MSNQLVFSRVEGPQGKFEVSSVKTYAGGAADVQPLGSPFKLSDYDSDTPWPYETMVFRPMSAKGIYHEPHATLVEAQARHGHIVAMCERGDLPIGRGVRGDFGVPSKTSKEWFQEVQDGGSRTGAPDENSRI